MKTLSLCAMATCCFVAQVNTVHAQSAYDGSWALAFATQRGTCDPSYNFNVNISKGVVTEPNLVKFRGYVAKSGAVRASVTVQNKYASVDFPATLAAGHGAATPELHDAPVTGPRNEIDIQPGFGSWRSPLVAPAWVPTG
jgi:hypothetical protein